MNSYRSINPSTGELFAETDGISLNEAITRVERAANAFESWKSSSFKERATFLHAVAFELEDRVEDLARWITQEMGKTISESRTEISKSAMCARHYADHAETFLAPVSIESDARSSYVQHLPLGPLLGILPWNFPFWLAFRFCIPAIMGGNTVLIKPDPHLPACSDLLMDVFQKAGAPDGLIQLLQVDHDTISTLIKSPHIAGVSFTGSTLAGRRVGEMAGKNLKPMVLELGGSDPAIVLADADLEKAAKAIALSRCINNGQSCIAAKRIIVERGVHDTFLEKLERELRSFSMGDPLLDTTKIGPLARADLRTHLHEQIQATIKEGATLKLGGEIPSGPGFFYPVTLLTHANTSMTACREETFGPVAVTLEAASADQAIELANATDYGLAASIWTQRDRGEELAQKIQAGQIVINGVVKTDPRLPSGGVKSSGIGRELGPQGILEFVNTQQVWVGE